MTSSKDFLVTLYIDGASRGNPGPASVGCFIKRDGQVLLQQGYYLGTKTNNQAEYAALLIGLHLAKGLLRPDDHLHIVSDSELLVKQLTGHYRVRDPLLQVLFARAQCMLQNVDYRITHVLRVHNTHADALANQALDQKKSLPAELAPLVTLHA